MATAGENQTQGQSFSQIWSTAKSVWLDLTGSDSFEIDLFDAEGNNLGSFNFSLSDKPEELGFIENIDGRQMLVILNNVCSIRKAIVGRFKINNQVGLICNKKAIYTFLGHIGVYIPLGVFGIEAEPKQVKVNVSSQAIAEALQSLDLTVCSSNLKNTLKTLLNEMNFTLCRENTLGELIKATLISVLQDENLVRSVRDCPYIPIRSLNGTQGSIYGDGENITLSKLGKTFKVVGSFHIVRDTDLNLTTAYALSLSSNVEPSLILPEPVLKQLQSN